MARGIHTKREPAESRDSAAERRQRKASGVSPRYRPDLRITSCGAATGQPEHTSVAAPQLEGLAVNAYLGLAPEALCCRRSAASLTTAILLLIATAGCQTSRQVTTVPSHEPLRHTTTVEATDSVITAAYSHDEDGSTATTTGHWRATDKSDAKPVDAMTIGDIERLTFEHNPTLSAASARLHAAQGRHVQAGLYPNPVIGYHATEVGNIGTPGQQGGFVSQRFITGGKLELDQAIAAREIDEASFRIHAQEQRVLNDVRVRFYTALVAQQRVELTTELADIGDNLVKAAGTLLESGQGTPNDLLQAEVRADESRILLDNARNEQNEARRRLAAAVGVPTLEAKALAGDLETSAGNPVWDDAVASLLADHPELNAARQRVDRATFAVERATVTPIPNVDVSVSVRHHNVTGSDVANVQVGIPIPVFDANEGNISAAQSELVAAQKDVERIELNLQDRLAVEFQRYTSSRQQVNRYADRIVPRAKESLQLVTEGYEAGQVAYLTLLTAQQTYVQVNLSYLNSLQELLTSSVVIEGQLLTDSLTE